MAMCNKSFHRLCNEWKANYQLNDYLIELCESMGVNRYSDFIDTDIMNDIRKLCKANAVWLQDSDEEDLYLELMPFGGYEGNYKVLKEALKEYRKAEHKRGVVDMLVMKYGKE